jgi:hypothetical protein
VAPDESHTIDSPDNYAATVRHTLPKLKDEAVLVEIGNQASRFSEWLEKKAEAL